MKQLRSFLSLGLFGRKPPEGWGAGKRLLFWLWNGGMLLLGALGIGCLSLLFAAVIDRGNMFLSYFQNPWIAFLNLAPVVLLTALLYFLTGRAALAYGISAVIVMGFTMGSWFKLQFRNDPLYFEELLYLREAGNMTGQYHLFFTVSMAAALALLLAGLAALLLLVRGRPGKWVRLGGAAAVLLLCIPMGRLLLSEDLYSSATANNALINRWSETQVYVSKGFVYPFLHSISDAIDTPPAGYSQEEAAALLARYEDADIPEDKKVSVITVMLEAFNDFSRFGVPNLDPAVYEGYHALEAESYTGDLIANIFAGGTINSERCYLTGFSDLGTFRAATNAYPWYFQSQGYYTTGAHPCYAWFYNRENINRNLGFQDYWFVENYFSPLTDGGVGLDDVFFPELEQLWEEAKERGQPVFAYNLSYQGHGPYNDDVTWWGDWYVDEPDLTQEQQNILNNYFGSVYDTIGHMNDLVDYFRQESEPVVLVFYGDHNPWLGDGNAVYDALGMNLDVSTEKGFYNYYSTRYLIWANDAAKEALGSGFVGEGPAISPNYLMTLLFDLCGWEGPAYLQATREVMARVPVINTPTGLYVENGVLTDTLSREGQTLVDQYRKLQYYYRRTFLYGS